MGAIKALFTGAAKIAIALLLVVVVLVLGVWAYSSWQTHNQTLRERPLAAKKAWEASSIVGDLPVEIATAWRDGKAFYQVTIKKFDPQKINVLPDAFIELVFSDQDGFKLWQKRISLNEMTTTTDKSGTGATGFTWAGDAYVSSDDYARGSTVNVVWGGLDIRAATPLTIVERRPLPTPEPARPSWRTQSNWRKLSDGQTEGDVRQLLGEPTNVNRIAAGYFIWRYGDIVNGGEVTFIGSKVTSWREP